MASTARGVWEVWRVKVRLTRSCWPALAGVLLLTGCSKEYPEDLRYQFRPHPEKNTKNEQVFIGSQIKPRQRQDVSATTEEYFGTPRHPRVGLESGEAKDLGQQLDRLLVSPAVHEKNPEWQIEDVLEHGASVYRRQCLYCHGVEGDGNGPTGQFLNPKPRDFRRGLFKFKSTVRLNGGKPDTGANAFPSRADLRKTIAAGVPTASMPAFNLLSDVDLDSLVSYVIHLSLRGRFEYALAKDCEAHQDPKKDANFTLDVDDAIKKVTKDVADWAVDVQTPYPVPAIPKSGDKFAWGTEKNWTRARDLFAVKEKGGCLACHGADGRSSITEVPDNVTRRNEWGDLIQPRNLTQGVFRGGSRPIDLFYRIRLGIYPSGMPPASANLTDEEIWVLVDYVMSLSRQSAATAKVSENLPERTN
jgi:mono/diheme cytochrome c family protein